MKLINVCPECSSQLLSQSHCACGWAMSVKSEIDTIDYQCRHIASGERCELEGTISLRGSNKSWYCHKHWYRADYLKNSSQY